MKNSKSNSLVHGNSKIQSYSFFTTCTKDENKEEIKVHHNKNYSFVIKNATQKNHKDEIKEYNSCHGINQCCFQISQNKCNCMEDAFTFIDSYGKDKNKTLILLSDGHGGDFVSNFCVEKIPKYFKRCFSKKSTFESAVKTTFEKVNERLLEDKEAQNQGATCLLVYIVKEHKKKELVNHDLNMSFGPSSPVSMNLKTNRNNTDFEIKISRGKDEDINSPTLNTKFNTTKNVNLSNSNTSTNNISNISKIDFENLSKYSSTNETVTHHLFIANIGDTKANLLSISNFTYLLNLAQQHEQKDFLVEENYHLLYQSIINYDNKNSKQDLEIIEKYKDLLESNSLDCNQLYSNSSNDDYFLCDDFNPQLSKSKKLEDSINLLIKLNDSCTVTTLTQDHLLTNDSERNRIKHKGGVIIKNRLNGALQLTRSFGDFKYTKHGLICEPYTIHKKIKQVQDKADFLVLGSDGLWDYIEEKELPLLFFKSEFNNKNLASLLVEKAKERGSRDNITCSVVQI